MTLSSNASYYSLPQSDILNGCKMCYQNARALIKSATASGKLGSYGIANSLAILAGEECVKGFILLAVYANVELKFEIQPYFKFHYVKHLTGKELVKFIQVVSPLLSAIHGDSKASSYRRNLIADITHMLMSTKSEEEWWDRANESKMAGLYVDFKKGNFLNPPGIIDEGTFKYSRSIVRRYVRSLSVVGSLPINS